MTDKCGPRGGAFTMDSMPNAESLPQDPLSYPYPNISSFPAPPSTSWIRDVAEKRFLSERQVGPSLADSFPWTRSIFQQLNIQRAAQSIWMLGGHLAFFFIFYLCFSLLFAALDVVVAGAEINETDRLLTQFYAPQFLMCFFSGSLPFFMFKKKYWNHLSAGTKEGDGRAGLGVTEECAKSMSDCVSGFLLYFSPIFLWALSQGQKALYSS